MEVDNIGSEWEDFQLPTWRPGRYELGDFSKKIGAFKAFSPSGESLTVQKKNHSLWSVETKGEAKIIINYTVYGDVLNAGSSYLDQDLLYLNPVNTFFYRPDQEEGYEIGLDIPADYRVSWPLKEVDGIWKAADKEELFESVLMASEAVKYDFYEVEGYRFHLWFVGNSKPAWRKLKRDFTRFTKAQIKAFGDFPVPEYHFQFLCLPKRFYHGVEHTASTVIALGPAGQLMKGERYESLLGVSSHELYHTWNIKQIRPAELWPYDYTGENYTRMGYLAEGVTTYMGDVFLALSGVFTWEQFKQTQEENLQKHADNFGRLNLSLADSSFDLWVDGYEPGIPNRKVSIYADGALCIFLIDRAIRKKSEFKQNFHDLMKRLYHDFPKKGKGVSEADFRALAIEMGGAEAEKIIDHLMYGTDDYSPYLKKAFAEIGLKRVEEANPKLDMRLLGIKAIKSNGKDGKIVSKMAPNSPAEKGGIGVGDEILAVNGNKIKTSLSAALESLEGKEVALTVKNAWKTRNLVLKLDGKSYYPLQKLAKIERPSSAQKKAFEDWTGIEF